MDHADKSSFLHITGMTRRAFRILHNIIFPTNTGQLSTQRQRGRPTLLPTDGMLGLLLFYLGSTMTTKYLCLLFGITPSCCSRILKKMLILVAKKLRHHPRARVTFPNDEKMKQFAAMINHREPLVDDIIGYMDGVSLSSECTSERIAQNAMYCGYDCDTMVNNILAYGPDGKVFFCAINFPGSWADGSVIARFLPYILERIGSYKIVVDQGFPRSGAAQNVLVGPLSKRAARRLHPTICDYLLRISNIYTSLSQASEWGMRGLQGTFPRCKKRLPSDAAKRRLVLENIVLIHNFRTGMVGYNQIRTVFDIEYERIRSLDGYNRIRQYYFWLGDYHTSEDDDKNDGSDSDDDSD